MDKLPRPKVVGGIIVKAVTGCGNMYVQLGWWNGSVHEVFATLGRGGGCAMGLNEAITRSITTGLRRGVPISDYAKQLRGVRCPNPVPFPKEDAVLSCPDAIAKVLSDYGSLTIDDLVGLILGLNGDSEVVLPDTPNTENKEAVEAAKTLARLKQEREDSGI